jgi:hypothetical protein
MTAVSSEFPGESEEHIPNGYCKAELRKATGRCEKGDIREGISYYDDLHNSGDLIMAREDLISRTRSVKRAVKRWRNRQMVVRWVAAGVLEAVKGFRRLKGHKKMPKLVAALRARDQQFGLSTRETAERVA